MADSNLRPLEVAFKKVIQKCITVKGSAPSLRPAKCFPAVPGPGPVMDPSAPRTNAEAPGSLEAVVRWQWGHF